MAYSLKIDANFSWTLHYREFELTSERCPVLAGLPAILNSVSRVQDIFTILSKSTTCVGNSDQRFLDLASQRGGHFNNSQGMTHLLCYILQTNFLCFYQDVV